MPFSAQPISVESPNLTSGKSFPETVPPLSVKHKSIPSTKLSSEKAKPSDDMALMPFQAALGAMIIVVPLVLGIPGDTTATYTEGWLIAFYAVFGYLAGYCLFFVLWVLSRLLRIPALASFAHGFVWIAMAAFVVAQNIAWTKMLSI